MACRIKAPLQKRHILRKIRACFIEDLPSLSNGRLSPSAPAADSLRHPERGWSVPGSLKPSNPSTLLQRACRARRHDTSGGLNAALARSLKPFHGLRGGPLCRRAAPPVATILSPFGTARNAADTVTDPTDVFSGNSNCPPRATADIIRIPIRASLGDSFCKGRHEL